MEERTVYRWKIRDRFLTEVNAHITTVAVENSWNGEIWNVQARLGTWTSKSPWQIKLSLSTWLMFFFYLTGYQQKMIRYLMEVRCISLFVLAVDNLIGSCYGKGYQVL